MVTIKSINAVKIGDELTFCAECFLQASVASVAFYFVRCAYIGGEVLLPGVSSSKVAVGPIFTFCHQTQRT